MQRWGTLALVGAMAVLLGAFGVRGQAGPPVVHAAATWSVQVGADTDADNGLTANAYYPKAITINAGDTLSWTFPSVLIHTVTFDNGTVPPLAAVGIVPDLGSGGLDASNAALPRGISGPNAAFDPKVQISSGTPLDPPDERTPFTLSFAQPGVYSYECAIHGPAMSGTVTVLPSSAALPETPAQASARGKGDLAAAVAGTAGFLQGNPPTDAGAAATPSVHNVTAGLSSGDGISVLQFASKDLIVHRGDTVVWTVSDPAEAHTITFLSGGPEPAFLSVVQQAGGAPKFLFPANVAAPMGGTTYSGQGYLNSGFIPNGASFAARIDAPPGKYDYLCLIHAVGFPFNMKGTITVTE